MSAFGGKADMDQKSRVDASSDLSIPLAKLLLRDVRSVTRRRGELRLVVCLMPPAVLLAHIIGKALASDVFAGVVLS
jgi:hypothetical protein